MAPTVAFVATTSLADAHQTVLAGGVPFAIGAVAGAGMCAVAMASLHALETRSEVDGVADESTRSGSRFFGKGAAEGDAAGTASPSRGRGSSGVPVISRAVGAMSEEDAWAEIDALLNEDSPVSCDPVKSRDIYEIAFAELAREAAKAGSTAPAGAAAAPASAAFSAPAYQPAGVTASFMAAAGYPDDPMGVAQTAVSEPVSVAGDADACDTDAALRAALSSLDDVSGSDFEATGVVVESAPSAASAPEPPYAGHEDMWAAAVAILEEPVADAENVFESAPRAPRHETVPETAERASVVAEGERETEIHGRVNEMVGEELSHSSSQSLRRTNREFLRVIQGGTASMPRLRAEA